MSDEPIGEALRCRAEGCSTVRFARVNPGVDLALFAEAVQQCVHGHLPWPHRLTLSLMPPR